jgi:NADH-quinone oxidoreductase subunit M
MSGLAELLRLDWTIYLTFLGVAVILWLPPHQLGLIRIAALATALGGFLLTLVVFVGAAPPPPAAGADAFEASFIHVVKVDWIGGFGISYHLGADGISLPLLLLNGVVATCGVLFSWNLTHRAKEFFGFFLALIGGVYGVFLSLDLFLLFLFYELAIIPKYFVIAIWGSTKKDYAAMKLVLYSFIGSAFVLVGILAMVAVSPAHSFDLFSLRHAGFSPDFQFWCFPFIFIGFAVLAGIFPFHRATHSAPGTSRQAESWNRAQKPAPNAAKRSFDMGLTSLGFHRSG